MAGNEGISPQVCELARKNIADQHNLNVKRLDSHSQDIRELTRISDRITQLIEIQSKQLENQTKQLEEYGRRLEGIEKNLYAVQTAPPPTQTQTTTTTTHQVAWYESSTGSYVAKGAITILVMIVAAAIGQNYKDAIVTILQ